MLRDGLGGRGSGSSSRLLSFPASRDAAVLSRLVGGSERNRVREVLSSVRASSPGGWEVALLSKGGRLELPMGAADWIVASESLPFIQFVPVDNRIAVRSTSLPGELHNDPADRIIIATALTLGATLVTKDEKLLRYPHVDTLW